MRLIAFVFSFWAFNLMAQTSAENWKTLSGLEYEKTKDEFWILEHNPIFTLGKAADQSHILDNKNIEFEYEGEMTVDIALDFDLMKSRYPFSRLSGPANILIMPGIHSANISFNLMQQLGGGSVIGPMILNAKYPFQIIQMGSTVNDLVNSAALAAYESIK